MPRRVAIVVSHPIQHFCPQYSSWATIEGLEIKVFFASRSGLDAYMDQDFNRAVKWDNLKLDFPHEFLPGADEREIGPKIDCHQIRARLGEFSPSIVLVYGYSQPLQRRAIRWARRNSIPLVMIADSELRTHRSWLRRLAKAILMPRFLRKIDLFLTVGDANESYYRHFGVPDRRLVRCSFPIDVKAFDEVSAIRANVRAKLRRELEIPADGKVILMVGKLVPWKRQEDLIELSNSLQSYRHDVTVVLAGTGPEESALQEKAARMGPGGVLFAGFVPPSKLIEYYFAADIYAHCSETEPHSLAISEAIYAGLPVILSDRCGSYGPSDDVRPGLNGAVFPCGDVKQLSAELAKIFDRPLLSRAMSSASEEIAHANQALAHGKALIQAIELAR